MYNKNYKIINWHFRLPEVAWDGDGMDFEPHNSHFLSQIQNHETFDLRLDEMVRFKVLLLPRNLFQMIDEMDDDQLASNQLNLRLFQRKESPNPSPLGCHLDGLKLCWTKIKNIQIQIGNQQYRPFENNKIVAKVEKPEFMNFERELYPANTESTMNDIQVDIKLAQERRKMIKKVQ